VETGGNKVGWDGTSVTVVARQSRRRLLPGPAVGSGRVFALRDPDTRTRRPKPKRSKEKRCPGAPGHDPDRRPDSRNAAPRGEEQKPEEQAGESAPESPVVTEVVSNFERSWSLLTAPEHRPSSETTISTPNHNVLKSPFSRAFEHSCTLLTTADYQWPRRDLNPHELLCPRDFKSRASADSATRP
jgi:hypothetical protein